MNTIVPHTWTVRCLSTALSPITHMAGTEGNEAILNREWIVTPDGPRAMPVLSGNALRHRLVREPGARFLIERWALRGKLSMRQLNFLLHGGQLSESTARQDPKEIVEFHRLFPLYRLLGGSLTNNIIPGTLVCDRGVLVCRENVPRLRAVIPADWMVPDGLRPAEDFVSGWQYTRSDAAKTAMDLHNGDGIPADDSNLMIFSGQSISPGSVFFHGFVCNHVHEMLPLGALLLSLSLWRQSGGTIGGQSARGHGRLDTLIHLDIEADPTQLMAEYVAHVDAVKDEACAWLDAAFVAPKEEKKPAKGRKGKADVPAAESLGSAV